MQPIAVICKNEFIVVCSGEDDGTDSMEDTMKVVGIVAEYNPFHNGHAYQLSEAKRLCGADFAVVVMSGDFTQRGLPAVFDKQTRTACALLCGADLVLELPFVYATSSAEIFAEGAIGILDRLGVVDEVCFGTESMEKPETYKKVAAFLLEEPEEYRAKLQKLLKEGKSFPVARSEAAAGFLSFEQLQLLQNPNSLLGIEYQKAILRRNSKMKPVPVLRRGSGYHDGEVNAEGFSSATALRRMLAANNPDCFFAQIPKKAAEYLAQNGCYPVDAEDFSLLYHYVLLGKEPEQLAGYSDVSAELAARMASIKSTGTYEELAEALKTKQYTRTRVDRALLHVLLGMKSQSVADFREGDVNYARILGFLKTAEPLLHVLKKEAGLPVLTKPAQSGQRFSNEEQELLALDCKAASLYRQVVREKYGIALPEDYKTPLIIS